MMALKATDEPRLIKESRIVMMQVRKTAFCGTVSLLTCELISSVLVCKFLVRRVYLDQPILERKPAISCESKNLTRSRAI